MDLYVAVDKVRHSDVVEEVSGAPPEDASIRDQMRHKLKTSEGRQIYGRRKAVVEPVFGQIKEVRGFRRFSMRGVEAVKAEWSLVCLTHNLLKLFRAGGVAQPA